MITDFILATFTFIWCFRILRQVVAGRYNLYPYLVVLFCISQAAFLGGIYHGYLEFMPEFASLFIWKLVIGFIGIAGIFLLHTLVEKRNQVLRVVAHSIFVIFYFGSSFYTQEFMFSIAAYLLIVVFIFIDSIKKPISKNLLLFSSLTIVAAGLQLSNIKLHDFFTSDDMYHLVQTLAFYFFYKHAREDVVAEGEA